MKKGNRYCYQTESVLFYTDNKTIESSLIKKDSRIDDIMLLIQKLCFNAVQHRYRFYIKWIRRDFNELSDALSKNQITKFMKLAFKNNLKTRPFASKSEFIL